VNKRSSTLVWPRSFVTKNNNNNNNNNNQTTTNDNDNNNTHTHNNNQTTTPLFCSVLARLARLGVDSTRLLLLLFFFSLHIRNGASDKRRRRLGTLGGLVSLSM
jgi:hypothetical protein